MDKTLVIAAVLVVMVAVSAVQAVQLTELKSKLADDSVATNTVRVKQDTGSVAVPQSLDNLPQMVGGC